MKKFNPGQAKNSLFAYCIRAVILSLILLVSAFLISVNGQSLTFEDPTLELPLSLTSFSVGYYNKKAHLSWVTEAEKNASHFVIQRSLNGNDFNDAAIIFTSGNSDTQKEYRYAGQIILNYGFIWYRLKMVDLDGNFTYSTVELVRIIEEKGKISVLAYPNPAINELMVTVPLHWQNKIITYSDYNRNGSLTMQVMNTRFGQTEIIDMKDLQEGGFYTV